ncbi:MAG: DUF1552 domain-containing protein [Pirellulaceae bacterium]
MGAFQGANAHHQRSAWSPHQPVAQRLLRRTGGYRGGDGVPPSGATVDYQLSKILPQTLLPHLCIGMDSIENMTTKPTLATLSASGAGQPIFMYSDPNQLYQTLYGGISTGDIRKQHEARSNMLTEIEKLASAKVTPTDRPTAIRSVRPGI